MSGFEVFTRRATTRGGGPHVSLQRGGTIAVNRDAYEALGEPESVELLYDRAQNIVGLRKVDQAAPHAYAVRKPRASSGFIVSGRAFMHHYGIAMDVSRRYRAQMMDDVLAIDLKDDAVVTGGSRAKDVKGDA